VKYVTDLVRNEHRRRANSNYLPYVNETDDHLTDVGYNPATREADIDTCTASSSEGKKESELEERDTENNDNQPKTFNLRKYNNDS
jgi:hypothetical protein